LLGRVRRNLEKSRMTVVFVDVGISLDGFIAGPNGRAGNPLGDGGTRIHQWIYPLAAFQSRMGLSDGVTGPDNDVVEAVFVRTGAYVMRRHMFDEGEVGWPEEAPFHAPVFVVTHQRRDPWVRPGGTTFTFVTDGFESALKQARSAAGGRDVRLSGGADLIQQGLQASVVDELTIHVAPVLLGAGVPLFDRATAARTVLQQVRATPGSAVTHLTYRIADPGS
jgi:dihydrofolate reductase